MHCFISKRPSPVYKQQRKAYFYFFNTLTEHDTEKGRLLGVVGVLWKIHSPKFVEAKAQEAVRKVWQCSPTKASAYHVCHRWPPVNPAESHCPSTMCMDEP